MKMKPNEHILYIATHGLGDLIMSLPAIEFLSDQGYRLTVLVKDKTQKEYLEYTTSFKQCDVLVLDEHLKLGRIRGKVLLIWKLWSSRFAAAIPQMNLSERLFNLLLRLAFVRKRKLSVLVLKTALDSSPRVGNKHKVDFNIEMAAKIINASPPQMPTPVWSSRPVQSKLAPRIALAPGSGEIEAFKRWPASLYADLSKKIFISLLIV